MSCCGQRRAQLAARGAAAAVEFEYRGTAWVTVVGPATGRVYWFGGPGRRLRVHPADADAVAAVPDVVRTPTQTMAPA
jgi:hypothetical protein